MRRAVNGFQHGAVGPIAELLGYLVPVHGVLVVCRSIDLVWRSMRKSIRTFRSTQARLLLREGSNSATLPGRGWAPCRFIIFTSLSSPSLFLLYIKKSNYNK